MKLLGEFALRFGLSMLFAAFIALTTSYQITPTSVAVFALISIAFMAQKRMK